MRASGPESTGIAASPTGWSDARSRSIWRWQLILAVSAVAIAFAVAVLEPTTFARASFLVGLAIIALTTAASLGVPWPRMGQHIIIVIPLVDIVAVGLLAYGSDARLGFLWILPIVWIASYYSLLWLIGALGLVTAFLLAGALPGGITPDLSLQVLIVLLSLGFMGVTISIGSRRTRAFRRLLRRQFAQLGRTLNRVEAQERRASTMFNSLDTALARVDVRGGLLAANDAYRELYSISELTHIQPTGAVEYDRYQGAAVPHTGTSIARAARGDQMHDERVWLFDALGRWHALDISTRRIEAGSVEPPSTLLTVRDVTPAVNAAAERQTMSNVVSHELRNPLTAITGHIDLLLERDDLPRDVVQQLGVIENAGQRMQRLITATLTSEKPSLDESTAPVDVSALVTASIDAFRPAAGAALVSIDHDVASALLTTGDAFRLRQVIDNLVGNAVKYTSRGGNVFVAATEAEGTIELSVEDTGIGISAEDLGHVFDTYFRSESALSSGISGSGLGMGIARDIVSQHGGSIEIDSAIGHGTRVTVSLPLQRTALQSTHAHTPAAHGTEEVLQ